MRKTVHKWFWLWSQDKEKKFLEDMALQGWKLVSVGFGTYEFESDQSSELIYQFDYRGRDKMSEPEYLQLYEDAGWKLATRFANWYYFYRTRTDNETDLSLFNNNESKRSMYRRILWLLAATGFPLYYQAIIFLPNLPDAEFVFPSFYFFLRVVVTVFMVLHLTVLIVIYRMYRKLKDPLKE